MVKIVNGDIEVNYEWGVPFGPMPRLVVGAVGAILIASSSLLFLVEVLRSGFAALPATERLVACGLLLVLGMPLLLKGLLSTSAQIAAVTIGDSGMTFRWKRSVAPHRAGREEHTFVHWDDMEKIEWTEEGLEHEFKQYLSIALRVPISDNARRFKFLICDTRSYRECQALNAKIPSRAARPTSVLAVLQRS